MPAFAGMFLVLEEGQLLPALRLRLSATTRSSLLRLTLSFLLHFAFGFFLYLTLSFLLHFAFGFFLYLTLSFLLHFAFGFFLYLTLSFLLRFAFGFFLYLTLSFLLHFAFGFFLDLTLSFFLRLTFSSLLLGFPFRYFFLSSFLLRLTLGDLPFRRRFFPRYFPLLGDFALRSFFT